jgi:ribosome maturation factor RimP
MDTKIEHAFRELVEPIIDKHNAFLVDITVRGERNTKIIEMYIDTDEGINVKTINEVNKEINRRLQDVHIIDGTFRVSVSSPGLDRPLKLIRQYKKNIGRDVEIHTMIDGEQVKLSGRLLRADDSSVTVQRDKDTQQELAYSEIKKAFIKLPW